MSQTKNMKEKQSLQESHPELSLEADGWDPADFSFGSDKSMQWKCSIGHQWTARISDRAGGKGRCPICLGKRVLKGFNDLKTLNPNLAKQAFGWDPTEISISSNKTLTWKCSVGHVWEAKPSNRKSNGSDSCPICIGKKILSGFNDLMTTHPDLAKEAFGWDPTSVQAGSKKVLAWICPVGHKWNARVGARALQGSGCPSCRTKKIHVVETNAKRKIFVSLFEANPKLASQADGWDPSKVTAGSNQKKAWVCSKNHRWEAVVHSRSKGRGCPTCAGKKISAGDNDLSTLMPLLASEANGWDPSEYSISSNKKLAWRCSLGHEWIAKIASRTNGRGCPYCSGNLVLAGFNDLGTIFPDIAVEANGWDPKTVTAGSENKKSWLCPNKHTYVSAIKDRADGHGCPSCSATGFDQTKDGWFYLLEHPSWELMQLGISNVPEKRIRKHKQLGWVVLDLKGPMNGLSTRELETKALRFLSKLGAQDGVQNVAGKFDGYSESWFKSKFDVGTIDQLKKKIERDE